MQVIVNELVIHYEKSGQGPAILIVHGWGDSSKSFKTLQMALSDSNEVIVVDLPGFGGSTPPQKAWNLTNYAEFISQFIKKIDAKVNAYIGHSNGGAILIDGLAKSILSSSKLVLLDSAGIRDNFTAKRQALKVVTKTGKLFTAVLPKNKRESIRAKYYKKIGSDFLFAPHMQETFALVVRQDVISEAHKIDIPTLLVYGENDKATPVEYGELIAKEIKDSKLEIVNNAGHFVFMDQPQTVEKLIRDFLK